MHGNSYKKNCQLVVLFCFVDFDGITAGNRIRYFGVAFTDPCNLPPAPDI